MKFYVIEYVLKILKLKIFSTVTQFRFVGSVIETLVEKY
jgi:hypothetical protein